MKIYRFIKQITILSAMFFVEASYSNEGSHSEVVISSVYSLNNDELTFFHKDLINWSVLIQKAIIDKKLNSPDRIDNIKKTGTCFSTGACQKEISVEIPKNSLMDYSKFLLLSTEGELITVIPEKITGSVLLYVNSEGKMASRSGSSGRIHAKYNPVEIVERGFIFSIPEESGDLTLKNSQDNSVIRVTNDGVLINGKVIPKKIISDVNSIKEVKVIEVSNHPNKYISFGWSSDTPCGSNHSIFRIDSEIEEIGRLGWNCDL